MDGIKKIFPIPKKLNKSKSLIFKNNSINPKPPAFNYINRVENINLFNSNDKFLNGLWKQEKYSNNNAQIRLNENNKYNNLNNNFNLPNKNILSNINLLKMNKNFKLILTKIHL